MDAVARAKTGDAASAPPARARLQSVDALRGVAIAAVVALHTSWSLLDRSMQHDGGGRLLATLHLAAGFGVPLFVALSAFGMARRHDFRVEGAAAFGAFLLRRARQLLPAYAAWSVLSAAARNPALVATPGRVFSLLMNGTGGAQFYFIPMLFELYVWWPLLGLAVPRRSPAARAALLMAGAALSVAVWLRHVPHFTWTLLCLFSVYVAAGMAAATMTLPARRTCRLAGAVAVIAAVAALRADVEAFLAAPWVSDQAMALAATIFQPLSALYTCAATVTLTLGIACARPSAPLRAPLRWLAALGRSAYGVFLCHLLVAQVAIHPLLTACLGSAITPASAPEAALRFALEWSATLAGAAALTLVLERRPSTRWLVGMG